MIKTGKLLTLGAQLLTIRTRRCHHAHNTFRQAVAKGSMGFCAWHEAWQHTSQELDDVASVCSLDVQIRKAMLILHNLITASGNGGIRTAQHSSATMQEHITDSKCDISVKQHKA